MTEIPIDVRDRGKAVAMQILDASHGDEATALSGMVSTLCHMAWGGAQPSATVNRRVRRLVEKMLAICDGQLMNEIITAVAVVLEKTAIEILQDRKDTRHATRSDREP